jgi:class I fructose-bisphosphate aldolase
MKGTLQGRMERIVPKGRAMILAYDHGFEHGPRDFLENLESRKPDYIMDIARKGRFTAVVLHAGLAEKYGFANSDNDIPLILKLNGKSELYTEDDPYSPQLYSVADAIDLGATAVGYTVYSGSKYESQMHKEFSHIIREAHSKDIPVIGWMYPRGKSLFDRKSASKTFKMALEEQEDKSIPIDETATIVAYGARIGLELGADIVKVKYTGSRESYRHVVESAHPTKVVMSGGSMTGADEDFIASVKDVLAAGAVGIAVGRNVWQRKDPLAISKKLYRVIIGSR